MGQFYRKMVADTAKECIASIFSWPSRVSYYKPTRREIADD
jgi:hypothetical protein